MTLPEIAVRRPVVTLMTLVSLFVIGVIALAKLPLAFMPEGENFNIWVIVPYENASPKTIERTVLRPLEDHLGSVSGIRHMWSQSDESGARVGLFFNWNEDMSMKVVELRERVDRARADLPNEIRDIHISRHWDPGESGETIMEARVASGRDLRHGYDLIYDKLVRPIRRIPGVASVDFDGLNPREVRINLRVADLERYGVDVRDVLTTLRSNNSDRSLGVLRTDDQRWELRALGVFENVDEIRDLVIKEGGVRLGDVASVRYEEPPLEYGRHLDGEFALAISVAKESSANTVLVSDNIKKRVAEISEDPDMQGINFLIWEDQGKEIRKTIYDLRDTGIIGAILATLVLFGFLRRYSSTAIAVMSIPFSLVIACGVIWAKGGTMNTITLLGMIVGVGMLVDNAVVVMENINRYQEKGARPRLAALLGAREVSIAVIAATVTSVIVFLPIFLGDRSEMNLILRELGMTVSIALLASLFVSQTLIPMAVGRFLRPRPPRPPGRLMTAITDGYEKILRFTLAHPWIAPIVGITMIASAVYPFQQIDKSLEPKPVETYVGIRYRITEPMSLEVKEQLVTGIEKAIEPLREELHLRSIYSFWSERWALTRCYMQEGFADEKHMNVARARLREFLPRIPGVKLEVQDNVPFWQRNRGKRVGFRLSGEDTEVLAELAGHAKGLLESVDGLHSIYSTAEGGKFEVQSRVDRDLARQYQVGVNQAAEVVELTFRGRRLPRFLDGDREVEMRLMLDEKEHGGLEQLEGLAIRQASAAAGTIPLSAVADFKVARGPESIDRDDRVTGIWVGGRYDDGIKEEYVEKCEALLDTMQLPYGYSWEHRQFRQDVEESQREFLINLGLALLLIFAVMAGLFESVRQATSLMVALPFALVGALWTLHLTGSDFDQPAAVGLLLLLGIVVNNGIVMIEHINRYRREGLERHEAMLRGGRERLRPILMTAMTTILGLLPIAVQRPALAGVYYYSVALVVMGGLLLSTLLTTILLPTTVCLTEDLTGWVARVARSGVQATWGRIRPAVSE